MSAEIHEKIGQHSAHIETIKDDIAALKADVSAIRTTLAEARGGWRTLLLVAGAAGTVGAFVGKIIPFWPIVR